MKYFLCILVIALASQASAQLRCIQCNNCDNYANQPIVTCAHPVLPTPPDGTTVTLVPPTTTTTLSTPPTIPGPGATPGLTASTLPPTTVIPTDPGTPPTNPALPELTAGTTLPTDAPGPPTIPPPTIAPPVTDDPNAPTFTPGSLRKRRDAEFIEPAAAHFSCFRIRVPAATAGQTQINRGCVANAGSNNHTCWRASGAFGAPTECRLCSGEGCNSSSGLIASIFLVSVSFFVALRMF